MTIPKKDFHTAGARPARNAAPKLVASRESGL